MAGSNPPTRSTVVFPTVRRSSQGRFSPWKRLSSEFNFLSEGQGAHTTFTTAKKGSCQREIANQWSFDRLTRFTPGRSETLATKLPLEFLDGSSFAASVFPPLLDADY